MQQADVNRNTTFMLGVAVMCVSWHTGHAVTLAFNIAMLR